jgi:hypothetical protein
MTTKRCAGVFADLTRRQVLVVIAVAITLIVYRGWREPSALYARERVALIEGCRIISTTNSGLLTRGSDLVMDFVLVDVEEGAAARGQIAPTKEVTFSNFQTRCPKGERLKVWWDPRFPDTAFYMRWRMAPIAFAVLVAVFALAVLWAMQADAKARRKNVSEKGRK